MKNDLHKFTSTHSINNWTNNFFLKLFHDRFISNFHQFEINCERIGNTYHTIGKFFSTVSLDVLMERNWHIFIINMAGTLFACITIALALIQVNYWLTALLNLINIFFIKISHSTLFQQLITNKEIIIIPVTIIQYIGVIGTQLVLPTSMS